VNAISTRKATTGLFAVVVIVDGLERLFPGYLDAAEAERAGERFAAILDTVPPAPARHPERRGKAHDARRRERNFVAARKRSFLDAYSCRAW